MSVREKEIRFTHLVMLVLDKSASSEEIAEFQRLLHEYPEFKLQYIEQMKIHSLMTYRHVSGSQGMLQDHSRFSKTEKFMKQRSVGRVPSPGAPTPGEGTGPTRFGFRYAGLPKLAAAAILMIALGFGYIAALHQVQSFKNGSFSVPNEYSVELIQQKQAKKLKLPNKLPGKVLLSAGMAKIRLSSAVELTLQGNVELDLESSAARNVFLRKGKMLVYVPPHSKGLIVRTPELEAWDIGTIFSVAAGFNSGDSIFVFDGKVQVMDKEGNGIGLCEAGEGVLADPKTEALKFAADWDQTKYLFKKVKGRTALKNEAHTLQVVNKIEKLWRERYSPAIISRYGNLAQLRILKKKKITAVRKSPSQQENKMKNITKTAVAITSAVMMSTLNGLSTDGTWVNLAGGSWEVVSNWQDDTIASGIGSTASFDTIVPTSDVAVAVGSSVTTGTQVFGGTDNDYAWLLSGEPLVFENSSAPGVIEVKNREVVIANDMVTDEGLVKEGPGTLVLTGDNTSSSILSVNEGTLALSNQASLIYMRMSFAEGASLRVDGVSDFWSLEGPWSGSTAIDINGTAQFGRYSDFDGYAEYQIGTSIAGPGTLQKVAGNRQTLFGAQSLTGAVEVVGGTLAVMPTNDIVAWFGFDDPADIGRDSGPSGVSLSKQGNNDSWYEESGKFGGALKLNGSSCLIHDKWEAVPLMLPVGDSAYTIAAWMKRDPAIATRGGIASWGDMHSSYTSAGIRMNSSTTVIQPSAGHTAVSLDSPDDWQHVALTYDPTLSSGKRKIYVNGVVKRSDNPSQAYSMTTAFVSVGRGSTDLAHWDQFFKGLLDEVVFARTAFSQVQIQSLKDNGAASFYTAPTNENLLSPDATLAVGPSGRLLLGAEQTVSGIDGAGGVVALADRADLTVETDADTELFNSVYSAGDFVKKGAGTTLTLAARQNYQGETRVESGTLEVVNRPPRIMDGIVACYTFDNWADPYEDISENNIEMELKGSGSATHYGSYGRVGGCMFMENTYLEPVGGFPEAMPTGNVPFSISIWVNPAGGIGTTGGFAYWGYTTTRTRSSVNLRLNGAYNQLVLASDSGNVGGDIGFDLRTGTPGDGFGVGWHHLCYTYDPDHPTAKQNLYVDGQNIATANQGDFRIEPVGFRINCGRSITSNMGYAYVDDTIIFNRALSVDEVIYLSEGNQVVPMAVSQKPAPLAGVVGRYQFDDPANPGKDTSGHGNDLIAVGSGVTNNASGKYGSALSLDGTASWVASDAGYPLGFPTGRTPYTMACWFNPDDDAEIRAGLFYMGSTENLRDLYARLAYDYSSITLRTTGVTTMDASARYDLFKADRPAGWHHFAVVYEPMSTDKKRRLYIDGRLCGWDDITAGSLGTNFFYIGRGPSTTDNAYKGLIDDFVVMNRAATLSELHYLAAGMPEEYSDTLPCQTELNIESAGQVTFKGDSLNNIGALSGDGELVLDGSSSLRIGGGTTNDFAGTLSGSSCITVADGTVQTLPLSTFEGTLAVTNATLLVSADNDVSLNGIAVSADGLLGGEGSTAAPVTVTAGGRLLSRTGVSDLTFSGDVTIDSDAGFVVDASAEESDTGNLKLNGALSLPTEGTVELILPEDRSGSFVVAEAAGGVTGTEHLSAWNLVITGPEEIASKEAQLKVRDNKLIVSLQERGTVILIQ